MTAGPPTRAPRAGERGSVLITTLALTGILALLVMVSLSLARSGASQSAHDARGDIALQAADAGINRYVSRLVEDPRYWDHFVDPAEDPRIDPHGVEHPPGSDWTPGTPWTYAAGPQRTWAPLQDGRLGRASFGLRVSPPEPGSETVTVLSTARAGHEGGRPVVRAVESRIHPTSIADFQMISNASISYGETATTTGKVYSGADVSHRGRALAPVYAQRYVCSSSSGGCSGSHTPSSVFEAGAHDSTTSPSFADEFPVPIDFGRFTRARLDIRDSAEAAGYAFDDPAVDAWMVQFLSDGRARIWRVGDTPDPGSEVGTLLCHATVPVPSGGAMHFEQSVIVSDGGGDADACGATAGPRPSVVNGRVTVATQGHVYVGGDIAYASEGDDVLGLIAAGEVVITEYTPRHLEWRAASLAQGGRWRTNRGSPDGRHDSMVYTGSQTSPDGGYASMFEEREYRYDESLQRLRPPFYPIIEGSWGTDYWREAAPPS